MSVFIPMLASILVPPAVLFAAALFAERPR
jgi:hypothetical protein